MDRKNFFKTIGLGGLATTVGIKGFLGSKVMAASTSSYGGNRGPQIAEEDRLYQGPWPVYEGEFPLEAVGGYSVVMTTVPSNRILKNVGMGLVIYVMDEVGPPKVKGQTLSETIEKLVKIPFGQKLYMRVNWKDLQKKPGSLSPSKAWRLTYEMAEKYNKRIGFRVMLQNPNIPGFALPQFLHPKAISIPLGNKVGKNDRTGGLQGKAQYMPKYADPVFQKAWREFDDLLAAKYNGDPRIEYMDTYMYGFWGEGHNWPIHKISFPDHVIAEKTFKSMFRHQLKNWDKVPLLTNTEPDFNHVGNDALVRETLRTNNWLRSDTIYIENKQIEELSNRPSWIGSALEVGMFEIEDNRNAQPYDHGQTPTSDQIQHVLDVDSNYGSLWNWHHISADVIMQYYEKYPDVIDNYAKKIGYRIRPSFVYSTEKEGHPGLIFGLVNDGIAGVPGAVKLTLKSERGQTIESGYIDPGYPTPSGVRQARMRLPKGTDWRGLRLYAEINIKDQLYPVEWNTLKKPNEDDSLTLEPTPYVSS